MNQPLRPTWADVRGLVEHFDGAASELFVIDLPASHWIQVVSRIAKLPQLELLGVIDDRDGVDGPLPFDDACRNRLIALRSGQASLRSNNGGPQHLQIYLWPSDGSTPLDAEFVFWNDLTFPSGASPAECATRFDWLVDLAEDCRRDAPGARCILACEHNGDPREIIGSPGSLVW